MTNKTYQLDISIFFTPKHRSPVGVKAKPNPEGSCRTYAPRALPAIIPDNYFLYYAHTGIEMSAATITIGYKHILKLSYKEQYAMMVKEIKKTYKFHSDSIKYLFRFELQENGSLHAHGLIMNGYQNVFHTNFLKFGIHNTKALSYQTCRNIKGYLKYINKENVLPPIHNIRKKDLTSEMGGSGNPKGLNILGATSAERSEYITLSPTVKLGDDSNLL